MKFTRTAKGQIHIGNKPISRNVHIWGEIVGAFEKCSLADRDRLAAFISSKEESIAFEYPDQTVVIERKGAKCNP